MDIFLILAGFIVGLLVGLTGVGGGSLMTPILLLFFHQPAAVAVGTDLLYASITKSAGIFAHGKLGNIDWRIVRLLAFGSVPASIITTAFLANMDITSDTAVLTIKFWLGIALMLTALSVIFRTQLASFSKKWTLDYTRICPHINRIARHCTRLSCHFNICWCRCVRGYRLINLIS